MRRSRKAPLIWLEFVKERLKKGVPMGIQFPYFMRKKFHVGHGFLAFPWDGNWRLS